MNAVRKDEHRELLEKGDATLAKTKFVWLQKPNTMKRSRTLLLTQLIHSTLRTARAAHGTSGSAPAMSCKLEPMIRAAKVTYPDNTVKR